ncbi:hypothetical protein ES702_04682 [subsurface metagenome]
MRFGWGGRGVSMLLGSREGWMNMMGNEGVGRDGRKRRVNERWRVEGGGDES